MRYRQRIEDLLEKHGELTFQHLCHEMNCYSSQEVGEARQDCESLGVGKIGDCEITSGTILYPNPVGFRAPRRTELERYH